MSSEPLVLPVIDLEEVTRRIEGSEKRVEVLWQRGETLTFVARGREYRSEFHVNPSDEMSYVIRGEMKLHYLTPEGEEKIATIPQGSMNYTPAGVPHSPRFPPEAYIVVMERQRRPEEMDRFQWFCPGCGELLHEISFHVGDYSQDPVGQAYRRFWDDVDARTCAECGAVMPVE
ncbi:3-hydroxybutyryl-CoA dehydratase [Amycolatopsis rhabdoformis]|uniref:3-hydroxybutyryl-CoA dehydratase n=1 Tax=Amycolatopsis rhabdoformis TaxID=1448059 RepID=A0ABZ1I2C2_9PSEU|nr:3-hydroxybutyryl-CoA dehydratase [Amycolatopsis rhabdoformis]WSE28086.1 3-hydroxybutyryl-CoA dehydratase [Amycolatopsis rhabdoformis]